MTRGIEFEIPEWAKKHVYEVCKREQECECDREECLCFPSSISMGNSDYWPCYLRLMFIAAYRMVQSQPGDQLDLTKPSKELVLRTILRVCPSTTKNIPLSAQQKLVNRLMPLPGFDDEVGALHLKCCFEDAVQSVLASAGLGVLCELCINHESFNSTLSPSTISRLADLLTKLEPFFPHEREDLAGTPYDKDEHYNLMGESSLLELQDALVTVARLDSGIVGKVL